MKSDKERQAIELGKIWMKNSVNVGHDYEHAENVNNIALEVYKSLKENGKKLDEIDENLVSLAAWWHDSYKARKRRVGLWTYFFEGYGSERIVRRELAGFLSKKRLELVAQAVRMHNHFSLYFIVSKNFPPLLQILLEGDNIEAMSEARIQRSYGMIGKFPLSILFRLYTFNLTFWSRLLPKSPYMEKYLNKIREE